MDGTELARAYAAVLAAEIVADRSMFSIGALATRFKFWVVAAGLVLGCVAKTFVAVMFGQTLKSVPVVVLTILGAATLVWGGLLLLRHGNAAPRKPDLPAGAGIGTVFATIFFSEWADVGQLTTAFIASRSVDLNAVWVGSALALITKGTLATLVGAWLRRMVPARPLLRVGAAVCFVMAVFTLLRIED